MTAAADVVTVLEAVKTACLARGVRPSTAALDHISRGGRETLTVHEYPTTGGLTMVLDRDVYVNAPFDEWFCADADVVLELDDDGLALHYAGARVHVSRVLPLPGYLGQRDLSGRVIADVAMSHADRIRVSPFVGCAYD
ncbi:MAG: hypothetical protein ACRDZ8_08315, partial [Acidimicrobiales bacterium]